MRLWLPGLQRPGPQPPGRSEVQCGAGGTGQCRAAAAAARAARALAPGLGAAGLRPPRVLIGSSRGSGVKERGSGWGRG